jgi:hypothetical protein
MIRITTTTSMVDTANPVAAPVCARRDAKRV